MSDKSKKEIRGTVEEQHQFNTVKLEEFSDFLLTEIGAKYEEGLGGLKQRFAIVINSLVQLNELIVQINKEVKHRKLQDCCLYCDNMMTVLTCIIEEYEEVVTKCIDFTFTEQFLQRIQDRLEFIYSTLLTLEQLDSFIQKVSQACKNLCNSIKEMVQLVVSPGVLEIQKRASLCIPLLLYQTQTRQKYCEPVQAVLERIERLRFLKSRMIELNCREAIQDFLNPPPSTSSSKAQALGVSRSSSSNYHEEAKGGHKSKTKRELIFEEINQMVSYVKRLEFQIKTQIETPLKMFQLLNASKVVLKKQNKSIANQYLHSNLLNENLKIEEIRKIEKFASILGGIDQCGIIEQLLFQINQQEFFQVMQLLENQRKLSERHNQLPLVRERIEQLYPLSVPDFKDYMDKARKIHQRLFQMQEFEDPQQVDIAALSTEEEYISSKEIGELINSLKMQHEFVQEAESTQELYQIVKQRAEAFYRYEFCSAGKSDQPNSAANNQVPDQSWLSYFKSFFQKPTLSSIQDHESDSELPSFANPASSSVQNNASKVAAPTKSAPNSAGKSSKKQKQIGITTVSVNEAENNSASATASVSEDKKPSSTSEEQARKQNKNGYYCHPRLPIKIVCEEFD